MPASEHQLSEKLFSHNALKVLRRLNDRGFDAYLVGGCIRDALLGLKPKDFDVVTNATPEQIKGLFSNCRLIGRRFRLAHIMFGREIIEVATFRGHHQEESSQPNQQKIASASEQGQLLRDNVYGDIEQDAQRRDFSINALYYNNKDKAIYDYANGIDAINRRSIELIGDPEQRYREDPVRMLRAVRFATKLDMTIAQHTKAPIKSLANLLRNIPPARLFEETLKLFMAGKAQENYQMMLKLGLFQHMFPVVAETLSGDANSKEEQLLNQVFINTDERILSGRKVTPAFIYATMLWYPIERHCQHLMIEAGFNHFDAFNIALNDILHRHNQSVSLPKRFAMTAKDIWHLQSRLAKRAGRRAFKTLEHPKFRAGYDFLLLRSEIEGGKDLISLAQWWTEFQQVSPEQQNNMVRSLNERSEKRSGKGPKKRNFKRKKRASARPNNSANKPAAS
ncbi:polynucleotide adenylyltransferase PcnB [Flocculibacter collagenilyticus]|uniref:polynucleotide adenylyltransferase PcnB n=1 Tax=Flocculibacter collagenilyticus TaxID=2744479 RepID=UPI0018F6A28A|nr:polynucleotide adenylyltransferase PcnB [Flocculibacter collagenilyticus]